MWQVDMVQDSHLETLIHTYVIYGICIYIIYCEHVTKRHWHHKWMYVFLCVCESVICIYAKRFRVLVFILHMLFCGCDKDIGGFNLRCFSLMFLRKIREVSTSSLAKKGAETPGSVAVGLCLRRELRWSERSELTYVEDVVDQYLTIQTKKLNNSQYL